MTPGREVRLFVRGVIIPFEGTLTSVGPDALTLTLLDGSEFTISPSQLARSDVLGRQRNHVWGGLLGAGVGIGVGLALVIAERNDCARTTSGFCDQIGDRVNEWHLVVPPLAGAATGALVGYLIQTPRWVPGFLPSSPDGGAGFAIRWSLPTTIGG
jgi:hypothetical protein